MNNLCKARVVKESQENYKFIYSIAVLRILHDFKHIVIYMSSDHTSSPKRATNGLKISCNHNGLRLARY